MNFDFAYLNFDDIKKSQKLLKDIENILSPYLPTKLSEQFEFEVMLKTFSITENLKENRTLLYDKNAQMLSTTLSKDFDGFVIWSEYKYVQVTGETSNAFPETLLKPEKITSVFINNEPLKSEKYEIEFIYNPCTEKYYTIVGYGVKLDYNGGVEDYLQREIIQKHYPDSNYQINGSITTYNIGDKYFEIKRYSQKDGLSDAFRVKINSQNINIKTMDDLRSHATYFNYISIDDFALLTGLTVEKIDTENSCIYFKTLY